MSAALSCKATRYSGIENLTGTIEIELAEFIGAGGEEIEEAEVAEDLELLADFVADVGVVGMEFGQNVGVSVDVGESEFEFAYRVDHLEHVERPAALFYV